MKTRPRGDKGRSAPDVHCVIDPACLYRWPGAVSSHTGLGVPKWRSIRRQHPFFLTKVGEKFFVRGSMIIDVIERVGVQVDGTER